LYQFIGYFIVVDWVHVSTDSVLIYESIALITTRITNYARSRGTTLQYTPTTSVG